MSYTIIGFFPKAVEADQVLTKLKNAGYYDYTISHSGKETSENVSVEKKSGFWNWLLDNSHLKRKRFEYPVNTNAISVFTEDEKDAHLVKDILDNSGAIDVEERIRDYINENPEYSQEYLISEMTNSKIISKAKNNLFFTNERKPHHIHEKRIADEIDGLGNKL